MIFQTTTQALQTKTVPIISIPKRTRTKNQKRIESLLQNSPSSVNGITKLMLRLPNCPKEVKISTKVLRSGSVQNDHKNNRLQKTINKKELILFMIKKYNLFYDPNAITKANKSDHSYLTFRNYQVCGIDSLLSIANSKKYEKRQLPKITKKLYLWKQSDPLSFIGLENEHFQEWFQPPHKVRLAKAVLKQFCNGSPNKKANKSMNQKQNNNNPTRSSKIKKLYRAFSFFFSARFNCINISNKSRTEMKFGRNYQSGFGDSNIKKFGIFLGSNEKKIEQEEMNNQNECKNKPNRKKKPNKKSIAKARKTRKYNAPSCKKGKSCCHSNSTRQKYQELIFDDPLNNERDCDKLNFGPIKKTKKRQKRISFVPSSPSSGQETEREDYKIYSKSKKNQNSGKRAINKIILTANRNNLNCGLSTSQNMLTENENIYFEALKNKTENELEDELLSLLLHLKNSQN
ncbi:hypothetical protein M0812_23336 [Anaeramoeba flamelloides]|uniref:Uncharacterized protein n=1 Tax=Anaeramoeba flamelloides TaxID=1746091 RepID=A0AAV7YNW0_9EUKA|nr:hypothetical protein M0812_23336 [Anaeramoeba flamelloides]